MPNIYIDGDACPVKAEVIRVAARHDLDVYIVSNGGLKPTRAPKVHMVVVGAGSDLADDWIVDHINDGDIAVTADILLADRCLKKNAVVIGHSGNVFNDNNIGNAIAGRTLSAHLQELGKPSYNRTFTKQDRSQFLQTLENSMQKLKH